MPRVSVLLPTHNRADVLPLSIASIQAQTCADFELLLVADGCTDNTVEVVRRLGDPRIRIFGLPKAPGFGYANRNIALREATGHLITFAAHDDLWCPDHLELMLAAFDAAPDADWAYSRPLWVSTDGVIVPFPVNLELEDELLRFMEVSNCIPAGCVAYRRACHEQVGLWPEDAESAGDWRYWRRMIDAGARRRWIQLAEPTCLHFSAAWKQSRHSLSGEVAEWLNVADSSPWWPDVLRCTPEHGQSEQAAVWHQMATAPTAWTARMRRAVSAVIDRVAWDAIRHTRFHARANHAELVAESGSLRRGLEQAAQALTHAVTERDAVMQLRNAELRELEIVRHSRSWRWTAPLRAARRGLFGR